MATLQWCVLMTGDMTNLVGCLLTDQLPFQVCPASSHCLWPGGAHTHTRHTSLRTSPLSTSPCYGSTSTTRPHHPQPLSRVTPQHRACITVWSSPLHPVSGQRQVPAHTSSRCLPNPNPLTHMHTTDIVNGRGRGRHTAMPCPPPTIPREWQIPPTPRYTRLRSMLRVLLSEPAHTGVLRVGGMTAVQGLGGRHGSPPRAIRRKTQQTMIA